MAILVLKTDINSELKLNYTSYVLKVFDQIECWSVDCDDDDHILRIVSKENLCEKTVIRLLSSINVKCEEID